MDGTYTTTGEEPESLNIKKMMRLIKQMREKFPKSPIEEFANAHGFSLDKQDILIVSKKINERTGIKDLHTNIYVSSILGDYQMVFLRDAAHKTQTIRLLQET